ncbi:MAG: N-formylglutamate amidohydrolase [Pseudomonadota bacterium]
MASPPELALAPEASLLAPDEPAAFEVLEGDGRSPFLVTCDHAGRRIPRVLGDLGLPEAELTRHIAWDLGAFQVARELAHALGAFVITQTYSRLVIDCNRHPGVPTSIPEVSEHTEIPGNLALPAVAAARRARDVFEPYHARIVRELDRRAQAGLPTVLIAVHSFTPIFKGVPRPWHVGMLYNRDTRLAHALLERLRADPELVVGDNEPYAVSDESDYGIPVYGERRGIPHIELEIRQDLVMTEAGQKAWAARFAELIPNACASFGA